MMQAYVRQQLHQYLRGLTDEQLLALLQREVFPLLSLAQKRKLLAALADLPGVKSAA